MSAVCPKIPRSFIQKGQLEIISIGDLKLMDEERLIAYIIKKKTLLVDYKRTIYINI